MAYGDATGDNARLLLRTIRGTADFSGRSRRTEVLYYMIACALVGVVLDFGFMMILPFETAPISSGVVGLAVRHPYIRSLCSPVHDQGRSGWWGLLLPLSILLRLARGVTERGADIQAMVANQTSPLALIIAAVGIAVLVLYFLPGTDGANAMAGPAT